MRARKVESFDGCIEISDMRDHGVSCESRSKVVYSEQCKLVISR